MSKKPRSDELTGDDLHTGAESKMPIEYWAKERGHVDPVPEFGSSGAPRHAIQDYKGWIYQCVRVVCGGSVGRELTSDEYDAAVHKALHETTAR